MNIPLAQTVSGFQEYKYKVKKTNESKESTQTKLDSVELSNNIPADIMASYLDGSFLDDPKFNKQLEALTHKILNIK